MSKSFWALSLALLPLTAQASFKQPPPVTSVQVPAQQQQPVIKSENLPSPPEDRAILESVFNNLTQSLRELETMMASGDYRGALSRSKEALDSARLKTGIHPKASYREKIEVKRLTLSGVSYKSAMFNNLSMDMRDTIALTVANHRGGYFLDVLNLLKRVNLIYIMALQRTLQTTNCTPTKKGGECVLMERDRQKIVNDLLDVHSIPIYIRDSGYSDYFQVFDIEVANSDQNYLFNREIAQFIITQGASIGVPSESAFESMLVQHVESLRNQYRGTVNQKPVSPISSQQTEGFSWSNPHFQSCKGTIGSALHSSTADQNCKYWVERGVQFASDAELNQCISSNNGPLHVSTAIQHCLALLQKVRQ